MPAVLQGKTRVFGDQARAEVHVVAVNEGNGVSLFVDDLEGDRGGRTGGRALGDVRLGEEGI